MIVFPLTLECALITFRKGHEFMMMLHCEHSTQRRVYLRIYGSNKKKNRLALKFRNNGLFIYCFLFGAMDPEIVIAAFFPVSPGLLEILVGSRNAAVFTANQKN